MEFANRLLGLENLGMGLVFLRMVILFFAALIVVRLMGNRAIGQLAPFDFVIMVGIGDIMANVALDRQESLVSGIEALVTLLGLQLLLSVISLKSRRARQLIEGKPVVMIKDGQIIRQNLAKAHFNYDDLLQELHKQGMDADNIKDIKQGQLEGCGMFTIIKNKAADPATLKDLRDFQHQMMVDKNADATVVVDQYTLRQLVDGVNQLLAVLKRREATGEDSGTWREPEKLH